ncbi:hypothetical protein LCI18_012587 [Fusarium solani-melongenae]|uniref:Uncharacterized protein n=1 Tax=Fusarium solani subsp. cucurbitae TaxID=2747967 RepID=A0ACD3ZL29_FUSSC|nr:hypothetical protein LCI18_012587 [Fusarium solani-melongenae]
MPQQLAFVMTDSSGRIGSPERQLIRRHCMRQKNKQPGSRRSKREAARVASQLSHESRPKDQETNNSSDRLSVRNRVAPPPAWLEKAEQTRLFVKRCILPPPSDWALFHFPEGLDIPAQKSMHRYFIHNPIRDALYPFKHFGIHIDFDEDPFMCFRLLCSEPLCFRAMLLLTSASNDLVSRQPLSRTTYRHLRRVLPLLNLRLSEEDVYNNDIAIYVVSILASIAVLFGDYNAAQTHAMGLSRILRLRGGSEAVNENPVIQFSMDRLNFSSSLVTELWTPIYGGVIWEPPRFPAEVTNIHKSYNMLCIDGLVDPDLVTVFTHLQHTAIFLNMHHHSKTPVNGALIRQCLGFVHSGIIDLEFRLVDSISKCLHVGMMAFLATTFRLPGSDGQHYCKSVAEKIKVLYNAARPLLQDKHGILDVWLMLMGQICVGSGVQHQGGSWNPSELSQSGWDETRGQLKRVMWIDTFHDDIGRKAFETLTHSR